MKKINTDELKEMLDKGERFKLVNALSEKQFREKHIPTSISIPVGDGFEEGAKEKLSKDDKIVVYCASPSCHASTRAAKKLEEMGFSNVIEYDGGIKYWERAGYPLNSTDS